MSTVILLNNDNFPYIVDNLFNYIVYRINYLFNNPELQFISPMRGKTSSF